MANRIQKKRQRQARRKRSVRSKLFGNAERPRMTVFRSAKHIYVQIVDDLSGKTLVSSSTMAKDFGADVYGGNVEAAKRVGADAAEKAKAQGIEKVVFDRNGFRFHGRLKALADAAREKGLDF